MSAPDTGDVKFSVRKDSTRKRYPWCRACLAADVRMYIIKNKQLLDVYENLTGSKFNAEDGTPHTICYICYAQLQRSHRFSVMALKSQEIINNLLRLGVEVQKVVIQPNQGIARKLIVSNLPPMSIEGNADDHDSDVAAKEEMDMEKFYDVEIIEDYDTGETGDTENVQFYEDFDLVSDIPVVKEEIVKYEEFEPDDVKTVVKYEEFEPDDVKTVDTEKKPQRNGEKLFSCKKCGETFKSYTGLLSHRKFHKADFSCKKCDVILPSKTALKGHMVIHGKDVYICDICERIFLVKEYLAKHILLYHIEDKPFKCEVCDKTFSAMHKLKEHMIMHSEERRHACHLCDKAFKHKYNLQKHIKSHAIGNVCKVCNESFELTYKLKQHMLIHSGENPFACDLCSKIFGNAADLQTHKISHTKVKLYSCAECNKSFATKVELETHIEIHGGEKSYKCNQCEKSFTHLLSLQCHMAYHSEKPFVCEVCGKILDSRQKLERHMFAHNKEKPYPCKKCKKKFKTLFTMNEHMLKHTKVSKDMPFVCETCDGAFRTRYNLQRHIKLRHPEVVTYSCTICNRPYNKKAMWEKHMLLHEGKFFDCQQCDHSFTHIAQLHRHLKRIHGEKPLYACTKCSKSFNDPRNLKKHMTLMEAMDPTHSITKPN